MKSDFFNSEGYADPTPYKAIKAAEELDKRVSALIKVIKAIAALSGFEIINRIELVDCRSGRHFK